MIDRRILLPLAAGALALTACQARFGNDIGANETGNVSAEGKAKEGELSVRAPGFEMKVQIPDSVRNEMHGDDNDDLLPPNATLGGIHVEGGRDDTPGRSQGQVELAFVVTGAPDAIAHWYQDPARGTDFRVETVNRQGAGFVIAGRGTDGDGQFRVTLTPRAGGGTDGRILLSDRN
jgi:hypothetical protein